jgi:hypothetical protein
LFPFCRFILHKGDQILLFYKIIVNFVDILRVFTKVYK